jgi:hypothetical protein
MIHQVKANDMHVGKWGIGVLGPGGPRGMCYS